MPNPHENISDIQIDKSFRTQGTNALQRNAMNEIKETMHSVATLLKEYCPESRELFNAINALDEACMWANASIDRHG